MIDWMKTAKLNAIKQWNDPKQHKLASKNAIDRWRDSDYRKKIMASIREFWNNPESHKKASKRTKKRFEDPIEREKISGENNSRWSGGRSETHRRSKAKRRNLGYIPLNEPLFESSHGHHITKNFIIHIPQNIHTSISHNIWNGKNMKEINKLAFEYLIGGI